MCSVRDSDTSSTDLKRYVRVLCAVWTGVVGVILLWSLLREHQEVLDMASINARSAFEKDVLYRRWTTERGGVYVRVTEQTPPNPYLADIEDRDIKVSPGLTLTLINPAYMTRQVHELGAERSGVRGHLTSLRPIRAENAADPWEMDALRAFEQGAQEVSSIEQMDGEPYMRLMRPLLSEASCLSCHAEQNYEVGDIRGGISVSVPMRSLQAASGEHTVAFVSGHVILWLLGLGGISYGGRRLRRRVHERDVAQQGLRELNEELETRVGERTSRLSEANEQLVEEIKVRKQLQNQILYVGEEQQKKLGQELHDSLGQELTGIAFLSKVLEQKLAGNLPEESADAKRVTDLVSQALDHIRGLAKTLHPMGLGDGGLVLALRELAETSRQLFDVRCSVRCDESASISDDMVAAHLYRIAQEAITNAVRHGQAQNIEVVLAVEKGGHRLTVKSDGQGFSEESSPNHGLGLQIMHYRADMIGGTLDIRRPDAGGTLVTCQFPTIRPQE